jgi:hypothetical protein
VLRNRSTQPTFQTVHIHNCEAPLPQTVNKLPVGTLLYGKHIVSVQAGVGDLMHGQAPTRPAVGMVPPAALYGELSRGRRGRRQQQPAPPGRCSTDRPTSDGTARPKFARHHSFINMHRVIELTTTAGESAAWPRTPQSTYAGPDRMLCARMYGPTSTELRVKDSASRKRATVIQLHHIAACDMYALHSAFC